jgi:hypothetical protein
VPNLSKNRQDPILVALGQRENWRHPVIISLPRSSYFVIMGKFTGPLKRLNTMPMPIIESPNGVRYFTVDGLLLSGSQTGEAAKYAVTLELLHGLGARKQFSAIAQLYDLVMPGLILSSHLFQGLNRNLYCDGGFDGDENKFVFSRKPAYDYYWSGGRNGQPEKRIAPTRQVFVTVVSKNVTHQDQFPGVSGWIERWNWVDEDSVLNEAPVNWVDRYKTKVWSKE